MSNLYGIQFSKNNANVFKASRKDLAFTSGNKHLKVFKKGIATAASFNFAHGLGYRPAYAGYIKTSGRYFLNYFGEPFDGYQFDNTLYGNIYTNTENLHGECSTSGRLVYICYLNPGDYGAQKNIPKSKFGIRLSNGENVFTTTDSQISLDSNFSTVQIIKKGVITLNVSAIGPTSGTLQQTDFIDVKHGLNQANHLLVPDFFGSGIFAFVTFPTGFLEPYVVEDWEVSIDSENIRFRISRLAQGSAFFGDASAPAKTVSLPYFLTNIKLP